MDATLGSLTLDPSNPDAKALIADWQDGQEYDVTLHIKQTAPGTFDVMSATEAESPAETAAPDEEPGATGGASDTGGMGGKMPKGVGILIAKAGKGE
jgi:hypothetical protein